MIPRGYDPMSMMDLLPYILPAAYRLLPTVMRSDQASAMLMAIGLQETRFLDRRQMRGGPARSFWQFEPNGLRGVARHRASEPHLKNVVLNLRYTYIRGDAEYLMELVEHNDILACAAARLLLWTDSKRLPSRNEPELGWEMYLRTWHPGRPHPETWNAFFNEAWDRVDFTPEAR